MRKKIHTESEAHLPLCKVQKYKWRNIDISQDQYNVIWPIKINISRFKTSQE